ncbi:Linoleate 10R-lipoxygenase [Cyphellophora attinorum]|uniref:Linoleate 10R-lipoxygenase n=1 Tax=Cyphellophora attinorum TaxID=1664694 RepID=A0A0N1HTI0_9EURO|nr:Linoleate 10R-lipoxygenase [Phialophora attinorum]KPI39845.1 Linoleate 10R-lipoxygenase [Phialophora attinorum]
MNGASNQADVNGAANIAASNTESGHYDVAAVKGIFSQFASLIHAAQRPLPTQTGNGSYISHEEPTGLLGDLGSIGWQEVKDITQILEAAASGKPMDDRKYTMEKVIQVTAALPEKSRARETLVNKFVHTLWTDLEHPPLSFLGDKFKYRSGDGSNNNYLYPQLGAAYTPYARSVNPPPDPFLLFDALMARQEFTPHPSGVSSLFFAFASLVIHDCFQTDHNDFSISRTSSYVDLSTYTDHIRLFKDGKIKPDCFSEERLLAFPPAAGVILIMFNRFHNYVVEQLAVINEKGRFTKPSDRLSGPSADQAWKKYDNDLFQTGRLVTCGLWVNIILKDYVRTILNLNKTNLTWTLDPRDGLTRENGYGATGNQVSAEFALCYRWHSVIGQADEVWIEKVYQQLFHKRAEEVDLRELMIGLSTFDNDLPSDPMERSFAGLKRGADGKFNDDELAKIMTGGAEQMAGAFGARNTPKVMRAISALAIKQARAWNLCTLNEFRAHFGLKKCETFEEINSDPEVAQQLRNLYEHPDYVELYPGIMVEEAKTPMVPGVGIAPNHTLARAILADAIALIRGDRFYTVDYNAKNLTNWGFQEASSDISINQGCVFYKLMLRAFPNNFHPDSIYAHYPFTVPEENVRVMKDLGRFDDYNFDKPVTGTHRVLLTSYANSKYLLEHDQDFKVM